MMSPEEIKSKLILNKKTQVEIAERIGITRSQFSTIVSKTQKVSIELTKLFGKNPFQMDTAELKKYCRKK
jgi:transcriptional regulator with XRE-family HTH domain